MTNATPTVERLRTGAILASVVHATMQTTCTGYSQGWTGDDFQVNNSCGTSGAVTFFKNGVVGCLYDYTCDYEPDWLVENQEHFFQGMPDVHRVISQQFTLRYRLEDHYGETITLVSAVFWNDGEQLVSAVPWQEMMDHGGYILRNHLRDHDEALDEWQDNWGMSDDQRTFIKMVFERLQNKRYSWWMDLSQQEARWLSEIAKSEHALAECRKSFSEIGVYVPCVD